MRIFYVGGSGPAGRVGFEQNVVERKMGLVVGVIFCGKVLVNLAALESNNERESEL